MIRDAVVTDRPAPLGPVAQLSAAYAATAPAIEEKRRQDVADQYCRNEAMERVLGLQRSNPTAFATMPPSVKIAAAHYRQQQAAHEATEGTTR